MLPGFPDLLALHDNGRFLCRHGETDLTFYSERSSTRTLQQIQSLLDATPKNTIALVVAPFIATLEPLFRSPSRFYFIAPATFSSTLPQDERLITNATGLERFINQIGPDDKFTIHVLPQWQNLAPAVSRAVQAILERAAVRLKTIRHFGRLWQINFRLNYPLLKSLPDISGLRIPPDILILAGPSLDLMPQIHSAAQIWCADTALPVLLFRKLNPQVVFSLDAGFASQEHFIGTQEWLENYSCTLVADPLCAPAVLRLPFSEKFTYANSHPLIQAFAQTERSDLTALHNPEGNVGGLMLAACAALFPATRPQIWGHDRGHRKHVAHARGTAYFRRSAMARTRLATMESYALRLSRRYGKAP